MSIRILHAADLHLDAAFEGLSAEKAAERRAELRQLPGKIAAEASARRANLLFFAGDVFDSEHVYPETLEAFSSAVSALKIPVFIAPGNHDPFTIHSAWSKMEFPGNVYVFTQPRLRRIELPALGVNVWGAGYSSNACPPLLRGFSLPESGRSELLLLHAEIDRADSPYCPVSVQELAASGFAYAALGHVHTCSGLRRAGECFYAWPGCAAGRGFDECGEKGVLLTEISDGQTTTEFIPLGAREYRQLAVPVGENAHRAILSALPGDAARHLYRITLTGEAPTSVDLTSLATTLSGVVFDLTLWDRTVRPADLWAGLEEETLRGLFLRRMKVRWNAAPDRERPMLLEAVRLGLDALDGREGPL